MIESRELMHLHEKYSQSREPKQLIYHHQNFKSENQKCTWPPCSGVATREE